MAKSTKGSKQNWPSKTHGKPSGSGRDNNPPKSPPKTPTAPPIKRNDN